MFSDNSDFKLMRWNKKTGQQVKNHKDSLAGIAISPAIGKAASCGENTIKVHELHDLKDTSNVINIDDERGLVSNI